VLADYTFSKSQDNGQVPGQFGTFYGTDYPVNPFNLRAENSLSDLNQTHHFGSAVVWTPSYFRGAGSKLERGFLDGWILRPGWELVPDNPLLQVWFSPPMAASPEAEFLLASTEVRPQLR